MQKQTKTLKSNLGWFIVAIGGALFLAAVIYSFGRVAVVDGAGAIPNTQGVIVTGVEDRVEVLNTLSITTDETLGDKKVISWTHAGDYVKVDGSLNVPTLVVGGAGSSAASSSVSLAGRNNVVNSNGASAILAGHGNSVEATTESSMIVGARNSKISGRTVNSFNASLDSTLDATQNTFVIGRNNQLSETRNVVVMGDAVKLHDSKNSAYFGKNIESDKSNVFVYSPTETKFIPQQAQAFYINTQGGVAVNKNAAHAQLDIAGPLLVNGGYSPMDKSAMPVANQSWQGTLAKVTKRTEVGLCGFDGKKWLPLSTNAEKGLCVPDLRLPNSKPIHEGNDSFGANLGGQSVITNPGEHWGAQSWHDTRAEWLPPKWVYHSDRGQGQYVCGIGYHPGVDSPNGVYTGNCKLCTLNGPTDGLKRWISAGNGNNTCDFECKDGYAKNLEARTCVAQTYSCQGVLPEGARPVNGDDTNLTSNLSWQAVASNTARKCEYTCAIGYTLHNNHCARLNENTCSAQITKIEGCKVYFSSPNAYAIQLETSKDQTNWTTDTGSPSSPRALSNSFTGGYIRLKPYCNQGVGEYSPTAFSSFSCGTYKKVDWNGNPFERKAGYVYEEGTYKQYQADELKGASTVSQIPKTIPLTSYLANATFIGYGVRIVNPTFYYLGMDENWNSFKLKYTCSGHSCTWSIHDQKTHLGNGMK